MSKVLVTGGCGYIGSHTIVALIEAGHNVISIDSFDNSYPDVLDSIHQITSRSITNLNIDLRDQSSTLSALSSHHDVDAIIHFAAYKSVNESITYPTLYFDNNIKSLLHIIEFAHQASVKNLVFSSSCTVYGTPDLIPVTEHSPIQPANSPYGRSKQICEEILRDVGQYSDINISSLRYFNPGGAHPSGLIGERSKKPALNLIPVITETAIGKRDTCTVFGSNYDTRDGSCIRDYIHIMDLAAAHVRALEFMKSNKDIQSFDVFNLGIGNGVTVLEAIQSFIKVTGQNLNYTLGPARDGDVPAIYSNLEKAKNVLGWHPQYTIDDIMSSAWKWELAMANK